MGTTPIEIVILAGGQGTRFWPVSRLSKPKQFLSISSSGESLIQATSRRVVPISPESAQWVVTNEMQRELTGQHLPQAKLILEPFGRNTAASIGLAAVHIRKHSPKAVMVVLAADHAVQDEQLLRDTLMKAARLASEQSLLVTIGVKPTFPNTAYGYIKRDGTIAQDEFLVSRFFEKPSFERAKEYFESGEFYWNSGMFAWGVTTILEAIRQFMPELYEGLMTIEGVIGTPQEKVVTEQVFAGLESVSIDFGVLEHARNCAVVSGQPFGWNDVGSWDAWAEHFGRDQSGNIVKGQTLLIDSKGCVVCSEDRMIAVVGAEDLVVIDSGDALLVCPRDRVQDVREVVKELKKQGREELL